jgi:CheY-like chemotaxis protein
MAVALIVEDQDDIMPAIQDTLVARGDSFIRAASLEEARKAFDENHCDYVLLDLKIPARAGGGFPDKAYGIRFLEEVRATPGKDRTPVIAMTSYHSDGFGISPDLHALGVNACISKPFDEKRPLMKVIEDVLAAAGKRQAPSDPVPFSGAVGPAAKAADNASGGFDWAKQAQLVRATNQVLGPDTPFHKGTLCKAIQAGEIKFNGESGRACRVQVGSFLAWIEKKDRLQNDEVTQIRNAIIGEINEEPKGRG